MAYQLHLITPPTFRLKGCKCSPLASRHCPQHGAWLIRAAFQTAEMDDFAVMELREFRSDKQLAELNPAEYRRLARTYGPY